MQSRFISLALISATLGACTDSSPSPTQPTPQTVQVSFCSGQGAQWAAFQDGDGAWTRATGTVAGDITTFQHTFQTNRGGFARVQVTGGGLTSLTVLFGAPTELATAGDTEALSCGDAVSKALLGNVAGLDTNEFAVIGGGLTRTQAFPNTGGHFALNGLPSGPRDLIFARATRTSGQTALTSLILRRDVDLPDSATVPIPDFASVEAVTPATGALTIGGLGPEGASVGLRLVTATTEVTFTPILSPVTAATRPYWAVPVAQLRAADLQELFVSAIAGSANRSAQLYFRSTADRAITLPAPMTRPTFTTVATTPALRLRAQFAAQADYDRLTSTTYQQGLSTIVSISMTAAYAAQTPGGYDLVVPDLSGAAGFDPAWALHPGSDLFWTGGRIGGTLGLGANAVPTDGATQVYGSDSDTIPGS